MFLHVILLQYLRLTCWKNVMPEYIKSITYVLFNIIRLEDRGITLIKNVGLRNSDSTAYLSDHHTFEVPGPHPIGECQARLPLQYEIFDFPSYI